jgi:predicted O-methyltransferase YrrM/glycosyltransferase involved in cell wall biosynthesis
MIAVVNEVHSVAVRMQGWMLKEIGFKVYFAGGSYQKLVPNYHFGHKIDTSIFSGVLEVSQTPKDALFVDTHPETEKRFRQAGLQNPILLVWQMPVGPEWVQVNLRPGPNVGSLGWSTSVGREIARMALCPNDHFWPAYPWLDQAPARDSFGDELITVIENAQGWSNLPVLEKLRDHPGARLQLFGGGPPPWARKIPQDQLYAKMKGAVAMYHPKPFDTPGLAVMEAALQGVPIIFPRDWIRTTQSEEIFEDGVSCLVVETDVDKVIAAKERLRDREFNFKIGHEGRRRMKAANDWSVNKPRLARLVADICLGASPAAPAPVAVQGGNAQAVLEEASALAARIRSNPDTRPPWLTREVDEPEPKTFYYRFLHQWVKAKKPAVIVETGTYHGHSAIHMAEANHDGQVITIDIDKAASDEADAFQRKNLRALTGDSMALFPVVKGMAPEVDLLFLDSQHRLPHSFEEYKLYETLVRKGSLIIVDDIHINPEMEKFWAMIEYPKLELNHLHYMGFGIAVKV